MYVIHHDCALSYMCSIMSVLHQDGNITTAVEMLERASPQWGIEPDTYT